MTSEQFLAFAIGIEDYIRNLNEKTTDEDKRHYGPAVLILRGLALACRATSLVRK